MTETEKKIYETKVKLNELELYKFVHESGFVRQIEWQWKDNLAIWVEPGGLREFCNLIGADIFEDGEMLDVNLCSDGSLCIKNFDEVLEYKDIVAENILPKKQLK